MRRNEFRFLEMCFDVTTGFVPERSDDTFIVAFANEVDRVITFFARDANLVFSIRPAMERVIPALGDFIFTTFALSTIEFLTHAAPASAQRNSGPSPPFCPATPAPVGLPPVPPTIFVVGGDVGPLSTE